MNEVSQLDQFRGEFPRQPLNARRIAGALDAPGCQRRTTLDAAAVNLEKLATVVTGAPRDRQSPFAITRGNQFEQQVTANGLAEIIALARVHLSLEIPEVRQCDLSAAALADAHPGVTGVRLNELRAVRTRQCIEEMLTDPDCAYNLIRHSMTRIDFGGEIAYLEQDVLAFAVEGRIHVVEIKSFPQIDGVADPDKASSAIRQTAVYVLSLQNLVTELGWPADVVDTTTMIVLPENLSFRPTAVARDIEIYVRRLRRQLAQVPFAEEILDAAPAGTRLPGIPEADATEEQKALSVAATRDALAVLPPRFVDGCVKCPLFQFCREEAERHGSTARLGVNVASACGNVTDITSALDLAEGRRMPADVSEIAVAAVLSRGAAAARLAIGTGL